MSRRSVKVALVVVAAGVLLAGSGVAYLRYAPRRTPPGQPALKVLARDVVAPFAAAFDAASGSTRVVALLSPT